MQKKFICILIPLLLGPTAASADDIVLTDGTTYKNATIVKHDAVTATVLYEDGGATVPIIKLVPSLQKSLGYSEENANKQLAQEQAQAAEESEAQRIARFDRLLESQKNELHVHVLQVLDATSLLASIPQGPGGEDGFKTIYISDIDASNLTEDSVGFKVFTVWRNGVHRYDTVNGSTSQIESYTASISVARRSVSNVLPTPQ